MKLYFYRLKDCKENKNLDRRNMSGNIITKEWKRFVDNLRLENFEHLLDIAIEDVNCKSFERPKVIKEVEKKYLSNVIVDKKEKEAKTDDVKVDTQDEEKEIDKIESENVVDEDIIVNIKDMDIKDVIDLIYKESNKKYTKKSLKEKTPEELYKIFEDLK